MLKWNNKKLRVNALATSVLSQIIRSVILVAIALMFTVLLPTQSSFASSYTDGAGNQWNGDGTPITDFNNCFLPPSQWYVCVVYSYLEWHVFFEANVNASPFDGGNSSNTNNPCRRVLYNNQEMYAGRHDPDMLACAFMLCGHDDYAHSSYTSNDETATLCRWFRYIVYTERDQIGFRQTLQDLKNYIAIMDIEEAKQKGLSYVQVIPGQNKTVLAGAKYDIYNQLVLDRLSLYDVNYINRSLLAEKERAGLLNYVTNRINSFCSLLEEYSSYYVEVEATPGVSNPAPRAQTNRNDTHKLCQQTGVYLPNDLHVSSILKNDTLMAPSMQNAAKQFITNIGLANPIPLVAINEIYLTPSLATRGKGTNNPNPIYTLSPFGKKVMTGKYRELMIFSVVQETFRRMYNERIPVKPFDLDYVPEGVAPREHVASIYESLKTEALRRFNDQNWYLELNKANSTALYREMATIMATELATTERIINQLQRLEVYLSLDITNVTAKEAAQLQAEQRVSEEVPAGLTHE